MFTQKKRCVYTSIVYMLISLAVWGCDDVTAFLNELSHQFWNFPIAQISKSSLGLQIIGTYCVPRGSILTHLVMFICDTKLMASCPMEIEEIL